MFWEANPLNSLVEAVFLDLLGYFVASMCGLSSCKRQHVLLFLSLVSLFSWKVSSSLFVRFAIFMVLPLFFYFFIYIKRRSLVGYHLRMVRWSLYRLGPKYASESCKSSIRTIFLVLIFSYEYMFHFSILVLSLHLPVHLLSL